MKRFLKSCIFLGTFLFSFNLFAQTFEGKGSETSEGAVSEYLNALKSRDYGKIVSCYPVETFVENYNIEKFIEKMSCAFPTMKMIYSRDSFLRQTGKYEVLSAICKMVKYETWCLSENDFFINSNTVMMEGNVKDVLEKSFPCDAENRLGNIKFSNEFIPLDNALGYFFTEDFQSDISDYKDDIAEYKERMSQYREVTKKIYGCNDICDVVASFSIEGNKYYLFAETIEYGDKWYVSPNQGYLACLFGIAVSNGCIVKAEELEK